MTHHDLQLREEPAHLVQMLNLLRLHRNTRTRNTGIQQHRQAEFGGNRIEREHIFMIDRHLRQRARREDADRRQPDFGMDTLDPPYFLHALVRITG